MLVSLRGPSLVSQSDKTEIPLPPANPNQGTRSPACSRVFWSPRGPASLAAAEPRLRESDLRACSSPFLRPSRCGGPSRGYRDYNSQKALRRGRAHN